MFYFGFQIFLLFIFVLFISALVKNKTLRFLLIFIGSLFVSLQVVSIAFNGDLINNRFYEQIDFQNIWLVKDFFSIYIILFFLLFIGLIFLMVYLERTIRKQSIKPIILAGITLLTGICFFLPRGVGSNIFEIIDLKTADTGSFDQALVELGIEPRKYISSEKIKAKAGKNIIVLSLESLERSYLEPPLTELTPNLNALAKEYTYLKMEQQFGGNTTSKSLYTALNGIPAYFKSNGNAIFQNTTSSKIGNLGSVLQAAGYNMSYLLTMKDFAGMGDMLKCYGFEIKSDEDFQTDYEMTYWGIHDKDMFEELKKEIINKEKQDRPYAIFMSTISGHFPHGVYDKRMEKILAKRENQLEFMTSAVDYYIGNLFEFLKKNNILENTEVFIYPDHELMGNVSSVLEKFSKERGLYVITTADINKTMQGVQKPILQMDIPQIIVNGAEIETNATFLSSFLPEDKKNYLSQNKKNMLALNEAALSRDSYIEGFRLEIKEDGYQVELSALETPLKKKFEVQPNTLNVIKFSNDMRFISSANIKHKEIYPPLKSGYSAKEIDEAFRKIKPKRQIMVYSIIDETIYAYLKWGDHIGITRAGKGEVVFTKEDMASLRNWITLQPGTEINADELFLKSTGYKSISQFGPSRIYAGFKPLEVKRGINLLYIEDNSYKVYNTDTFAKNIEVEGLLEKIESLYKSKKLVAILVHDAGTIKLEKYADKLKNLGLPLLAKLGLRKPYLAIYKNGKLVEKTGRTSIRASLPLKKFPDPKLEIIKKDTMRFIAHSGGGINGQTYTNSLEALNLSYEKGFRLFELDIIKTTDNIFVAAHDWEGWKKRTKYNGEIPVNHKTFKENPIKNYTPMDIHDINEWFKNHPDAILITDKVNTPADFSKAFEHKDRLWMEVFSIDAAQEAKKLGIPVLLTQTELLKLRGKELETLNELNINKIAISRKFIKDNITLLKKLKKEGIKAYAFHLYGKFDANYILENEIDYIYGMYVDEWDFRKSIIE